jgi:succinyl-diaminopimelate desuccinylase
MIESDLIAKVLGAIDPEELIELTATLVKINSVWDPVAGTGEQKVAEYILQWAYDQGFDAVMEQVVPGRPNVIIKFKPGRGPRRLMFEGHTDVVTTEDRSRWRFDPFGAEIVGRRMYGRGACDTKGNLAAMLIAMVSLKRSDVNLAGTIIGAVLCDEEEKMSGVLNFIERGHADTVSAAVICEPEDGLICPIQKGGLRARYTITGRMSHGAMPHSGLNTAPALSRLIDGLHQLEMKAIGSVCMETGLGWPSFTPTVIQAPSEGVPQLNVIPGRSQLLIDVRTLPGQSNDAIMDDLSALAAEVEKEVTMVYEAYDRRLGLIRDHHLRVELECIAERPYTRTDQNDPIVRAADFATRQVRGKDPIYGAVPGGTDGTPLWALKGIPIVTMGAGVRDVPHQIDEWIDLDQLFETAKIYALTALHYLHPDAS